MTTTYVRISTVYSSEVGSFAPGGSLPTITRAGVPVSDTDLIPVMTAAQNAGIFLDTSATPFNPAAGVTPPTPVYLVNGKIPISLLPTGTDASSVAIGNDSRFGTPNNAVLAVVRNEVAGTYGARPATGATTPVIWFGTVAPAGGGTTAGGAGSVDNLDVTILLAS